MPNFDTGHYFLTVLSPIRIGSREGRDGRSYRHTLHEVLASMPHSEATANSRGIPDSSPFARNRMTHLARFVLIDDVLYNGRENIDTLGSRLSGIDPLAQQPVDRLSTGFLLFAAEFDAPDGSDSALRAFTDTLWGTMQRELMAIYGNCYGFEGVATKEQFFEYVKRCQVETTMPFNDYYPDDPRQLQLPPDMPLPLRALRTGAITLAVMAALWLLTLLLYPFLPDGELRDAAGAIARWGLVVLPLLLAAAAGYLYWIYRQMLARGAEPLPKSASLPEVLKSLYLQQHFTDFVISNQLSDPAALHAAFGRFLEAHVPDDPDRPTQRPGLISRPGQDFPPGAAA